ncbi:MAG: hypothetical protein V7642_4608 [Burkholderiales bacterium]|jgi:hypothetical protein
MIYKGYQIVPHPVCEGDGMWIAGYEILKDGRTISNRLNIFPRSLYFKAACADSIGQAKIEIENLVASASSVLR